MSLAATLSADLQFIEGELPDNSFSYTYSDSTVVSGPCVPTAKNSGEQLIVGGKLATVKQTLIIRTSLFTGGAPSAQKPITFNASEYRIAEVRTPGPGAHYELPLVGLDEL